MPLTRHLRSITSRAEADDMIDRAVQDAADGERWLNPPHPIPASRIYLLPPAARSNQLLQCSRLVPADTVRAMRRGYRDARNDGVHRTYARQAVIAGALIDWELV